MNSVTQKRMKELENTAIANGACETQLMEEASSGITREILLRHPKPSIAIAYIGKGNNGGDALVVLSKLQSSGWDIYVRSAYSPAQITATCKNILSKNTLFKFLEKEQAKRLTNSSNKDVILLDGLLGIGAKGPLQEPLDTLALEMNEFRSRGATTIAIDLPSGVNGDTGQVYTGAVIADHTCAIGLPKIGILEQEAVNNVGSISSIPMAQLHSQEASVKALITPYSWKDTTRPFEFHKGQAGKIGILAGSEGMLGAACLTSMATLYSGAGLATILCPDSIASMLAIKAPDEVMVKTVQADDDPFSLGKFDCLAIGPGIGSNTGTTSSKLKPLLKKIILSPPCPLVIDADGINFLARHKLLKYLNSETVITPHPGELSRLFPDSNNLNRSDTISILSQKTPATIVLKGARTLVKKGSSQIFVNSTGHPGMATAGQGDILTGVISALIGQGHHPFEAALRAVWLCGRASEIACQNSAPESLVSSATAKKLAYAIIESKRKNV